MKKRHRVRVLAALAASTLVVGVAACGDDDTENSGGSRAQAGNGADLAFIDNMVPHHESAVVMAQIAEKRARSVFIKGLAEDIITAQKREISSMEAVRDDLVSAGVKKGDLGVPAHLTGMEEDSAELKTARPFDRAFIDMMVPHHQGAIRMARAELARGENPTLKRLARDIVDAQAYEIRAMNRFRRSEFGSASPAGGVPGATDETQQGDGGHSGGHGG